MRLSVSDPVRTARLVLRGVGEQDADALLAYRSLPALARYVPFEPYTAADVSESLAGRWSRRTIADEGDGVLLGVERADTGELIGDVSLTLASTLHRCGEIGWTLHPAHAGQGFATEAAHGVLHLMFERLGLHRVIARVDARNEPSLALCERLGMRREGVLRENEWFKGGWSDEIDYALLEQEWAAQHPDGPVSCRWPLLGG